MFVVVDGFLPLLWPEFRSEWLKKVWQDYSQEPRSPLSVCEHRRYYHQRHLWRLQWGRRRWQPGGQAALARRGLPHCQQHAVDHVGRRRIRALEQLRLHAVSYSIALPEIRNRRMRKPILHVHVQQIFENSQYSHPIIRKDVFHKVSECNGSMSTRGLKPPPTLIWWSSYCGTLRTEKAPYFVHTTLLLLLSSIPKTAF